MFIDRDYIDFIYKLTQFDGDEVTIRLSGGTFTILNSKETLSTGKTIREALHNGLLKSLKDDAIADQETVYGKGKVPPDVAKDIGDKLDASEGLK